MKTINTTQNEQAQLERLAAQRQLYSEAKKIHVVNLILAVPVSVAIFTIATFVPEFQTYAAYWGIAMTFAEFLLFNRFEDEFRLRAANIQEDFDCRVLQLEWNPVACGSSRPSQEDILRYSGKYKTKEPDFASLKDWYPTRVDLLPIPLGRIICQRTNITWEGKNRRRYALAIVALLTFVTVLALAVWFGQRLGPQDFLVGVIAPLLPVYAWGIRNHRLNREAAGNMDRLRSLIDELWQADFLKKQSAGKLTEIARNLQDEIYDHRRSTPSVFDRLYKKFQRGDNDDMNEIANRMIDELR